MLLKPDFFWGFYLFFLTEGIMMCFSAIYDHQQARFLISTVIFLSLSWSTHPDPEPPPPPSLVAGARRHLRRL